MICGIVLEVFNFFVGGVEEFESELACFGLVVGGVACGIEERDRVRGRVEGREGMLFLIDLVVGREVERSKGIVFRRTL